MTPRVFTVDLTKSPAQARPEKSPGKKSADFPLKVSDSDPEQVSLLLEPGDREIRFAVEVMWIAGGESGVEVLDNNGLGFRVMGDGNIPTTVGANPPR
ncbi:hypothetical protein DSC45_34655 [Streptomyces sp. YIM 130001]|nr:hypothetical protein DSC45_34655 [Streptomyces sp. YIM 130001]